MVPSPDEPAAGTLRYRVNPALPGLKLAAAAALALLGVVFADEPVRLALAAAAATALATWAVRDLVAPVRVTADAAGVTVIAGYAGRRLLPWREIERIRVDARARLGLRTETLEIDAGETLYLFGEYDLGAPPAEAAARLSDLRSRVAGSAG
jgi:hypothetical protein